MQLRYVLLIVAFSGAVSAFLLAADLYGRMQEPAPVQSQADSRKAASGSAAQAPVAGNAGSGHAIGLMALGFIFVTLFLLLLSALRDPEFVRRIEHEPESLTRSVRERTASAAPPQSTPEIVTIIETPEAASDEVPSQPASEPCSNPAPEVEVSGPKISPIALTDVPAQSGEIPTAKPATESTIKPEFESRKTENGEAEKEAAG